MLQYVDGFACSLNEAKDKLVIHFYQNRRGRRRNKSCKKQDSFIGYG